MFKNNEKIILASGSPRRIEYFKMLGLEFEVKTSSIDEDKFRNLLPQEMVKVLSYEKAMDIAKDNKDCFVVGADTDVVFENISLGKPKDREDAKSMLKMLSGKTHQVIGAISLINISKNIKETIFSKTDVTFSKMDDELINSYVLSGDCDDKAGAYGIQGLGSIFIKSIHGSYATVVGLDIEGLVSLLRKYEVIK